MGAPGGEGYEFFYSIGSTNPLDGGGVVFVGQLYYGTPVTTGLPRALNGNDYRSTVSHTVTGFNWPNGQDLWLYWRDDYRTVFPSGANHAIAIDDVIFTANIPEPSSSALAGVSLAALWLIRRKKVPPTSS
jgi:hypothetical protein